MADNGIITRHEPFGFVYYNFTTDTFSAEVTREVSLVPQSPIGIAWVILGGCNLRCIHCYGNQEELPRMIMSTQQCFAICRKIADAKVMRVVISGGEPLMRDDIFDIIQFLQHCGVSVVLGTNGTYVTNENVSYLKTCTRVEISLDGADQITNNKIRPSRIKYGDAWQETMEAIKLCLNAGVNLRVITTLNQSNQDKIPQIARLLYEMGVRDWALSWTVSGGRARFIYDQLRPDGDIIRAGVEESRILFPDMTIRYSDRVSNKPMSRFYSLILPNGQFATEDVEQGKKISFGSLLDREICDMWTDENFSRLQHFEKWIGNRVIKRC